MRKGTWWVALIVGAVVIAGGAFTAGQLMAMRKGNPSLDLAPPTEEEQELQEIRIVTSEGTLAEATPTPEGWIIRFEEDAKKLTTNDLGKQAYGFFEDLDRTKVRVARASYVAKSSALKDVWGNFLEDTPVFRVEVDQEVFGRINWRGFEPDNFWRVASDFWIHEAVVQKEKEQGGQEEPLGGGSSGESG